MKINYEKEKTFIIEKKDVITIINDIFNKNFLIENKKQLVRKVDISPSIHFYFETDEHKKDVYKFKMNHGKFILNKVKKSTILGEKEFFNIEKIEKIEEIDDYKIDLNNVYSVIYKERMVIDFDNREFKMCFDRVTAIDPIKMCKIGKDYYFCEIEYTNPEYEVEKLLEMYKVKPITESKYFLGVFGNKLYLNKVFERNGLSEYLENINKHCYSAFFEQFRTRYCFYNKNIELELKIKNPPANMEEDVLTALNNKFLILDEGSSIIEDKYYDYNDLLLINNCSYRIRKTDKNITNVPRETKRNLFFKVPHGNKGIFSIRIEHMNKFNNYSEYEITNGDCRVNKILNQYLGCNISNHLVNVLDVKTNRRYFLLFDKDDVTDLIGMLTFDVSEYTMGDKKLSANEVELELFNDNITRASFMENYNFINSVFYKYPIDNSNKYLYARRCFSQSKVNIQ